MDTLYQLEKSVVERQDRLDCLAELRRNLAEVEQRRRPVRAPLLALIRRKPALR